MRRQLGRSGLVLLLLLAALPLLAACHTVQGAGQDITNAGQAIESGAQKATQ